MLEQEGISSSDLSEIDKRPKRVRKPPEWYGNRINSDEDQ